jgi:hypothetical protein
MLLEHILHALLILLDGPNVLNRSVGSKVFQQLAIQLSSSSRSPELNGPYEVCAFQPLGMSNRQFLVDHGPCEQSKN